MNSDQLEYVGFWPRVGASILDSIILIMVTLPLSIWIYGWDYFDPDAPFISGPADFLIIWVLPAVAYIWFWIKPGATPGKMAIGARIVDASTGNSITFRQAAIRYVGLFVSSICLLLGVVWVAFDPRRQAWHDKMARTVVVRNPNRGVQPVEFRST